jgi:acyl-CoA thioesterase-1
MRNLWFVAVAAAMCACQDTRPKPSPRREALPEAEAPKPAGAPDTRAAIVCFGDSLTAGFGVDTGKSYPDVLQREVDRAGYRYRVVNLGVSGETTQDGVARVDMALSAQPAVVVLEFGANDGLRGVPVRVSEENLASMIGAFGKAGVPVVLAGMTLPPNYGPEYIRAFEAMYRNLAAKYRVKLIPFFLDGVAGNPRLMQQDGLHPNAEGTRRVAALVFRAVEPLLKKS